MTDFFLLLAVIYGALSIPLAVYALWCHYDTKIEIDKLKIEIDRLDNDIDDLWPDDPDDGEDNEEVEFSNVIAFGKKEAK